MEPKLTTRWYDEPEPRLRVVRDSIEIRDRDVRSLTELRNMLVGPEYTGDVGDRTSSPTNSTYGYFQRIATECIGGQLKATVNTDHGAPEEPFGLRLEHMVNEAFRRGNGHDVLEMVMPDMACGYGGVLVRPSAASAYQLTEEARQKLQQPLGVLPRESAKARKKREDRGTIPIEPTPIVDADPRLPGVVYLDPETWGWDRRAYTIDNAEFAWYETVHDVEDLLEEADKDGSTWDKQALEDCRARLTAAAEEASRKIGGGERTKYTIQADRGKVILLNIWVRNAKLDSKRPDGHHGVWYTMWAAEDERGAIDVREPEWAFGPAWGPFVLFKQHLIGLDSKPFAALTANAEKLRAADAVHATAYKKLKEHRIVYVGDARVKRHVDEIEQAADGSIILVPGLEEFGGLTPVQRGGLDQHTLAAVQYLDARMAEDLGMAPNERGAVSGGGTTATEARFAATSASSFALQFRTAFNRGLARVYRTMGWYAAYDEHFVVPADFATRVEAEQQNVQSAAGDLGDVEARTAARRLAGSARRPMLIQGGDFSDNPILDFDTLKWEVNTHAQRPVAEQERRAESAQFRMDLAQVLQMAVQLPFYDWIAELRQLEEDYGRRGIVDRFDAVVASAMAQVQIEQPTPALQSQGMDPTKRAGSSQGGSISFVPGMQRASDRIRPAAPAAPAAAPSPGGGMQGGSPLGV
jgi:hypothetical protein